MSAQRTDGADRTWLGHRSSNRTVDAKAQKRRNAKTPRTTSRGVFTSQGGTHGRLAIALCRLLINGRRRRRALMMLPALAHLLVTRFHLREALLQRRADGGLLLIVQAVVELQPCVGGLLAQLRIFLFDLLMRGGHRVEIQNWLLLRGLELVL